MTGLMFADETTAGQRDEVFAVELPDAPLTLRDVIRARIRAESSRHTEAADTDGTEAQARRGLVSPAGAEDGGKRPAGRPVDAEAQCEAAFRAFERNGFLVLVGDRQIIGLDEPLPGHTALEVTLLKLIPLVGG